MADDSLALLLSLAEVSRDLALRVLPELDSVDPLEALLRLLGSQSWDGDYLTSLLEIWIQAGLPKTGASHWLWRIVQPKRSIEELAYLFYALESLDGSVDAERFFRACDRVCPADHPEPRWIQVEGGTFTMGSPAEETWRLDDEVQHDVSLSTYWIAVTPVTNGEYGVFDPQHVAERFEHRGGPIPERDLSSHPVVNVSWWEAYLYSRWVRADLPTEAQWECACRAGTRTPFSFGQGITTDQANYDGRFPSGAGEVGENRARTTPVGSLPANGWGLHDMHGNVYEWCVDQYGPYGSGPSADPRGIQGTLSKSRPRVLRGGCWLDSARYLRAAGRVARDPKLRFLHMGFRLARDRFEPSR